MTYEEMKQVLRPLVSDYRQTHPEHSIGSLDKFYKWVYAKGVRKFVGESMRAYMSAVEDVWREDEDMKNQSDEPSHTETDG